MNTGTATNGGRAKGRGLFFASSLALCAAGIVLIAYGLAVPVKANIAQYQLNREFEERLASAETASTGESTPVTMRSASIPRVEKARITALPKKGPVARISVERLRVNDIVLAGEPTHEQLARAPTMLKRGDAANPVTILAAHRDTHFLFIRDLREGDEVTMQFVNGTTERYRVTRFETVRWDEFAYPLDPARPLLALATCYPFGGTEYGGPLRRVAWAEKIA